MNMSVWRLQTKTSGGDVGGYCIGNHVIAMGWSLNAHQYREELEKLTLYDYFELADRYYNSYGSVRRLIEDLRPNDLIWMRHEGIYYLARICENSKWQFKNDPELHEKDVCNQVDRIEWIRIGDESEVPGGLTTAFIRGSTLQRINKPGILEYSELIYNTKAKDSFKYDRTITLDKENFYSLLSPSDCEDLLYVYLYDKNEKNYLCIPSTNKIVTEKYEFIIIDVETGNHIYIQVKNGNINLNADDYASLVYDSENKLYLLTTRGNVFNVDKYDNIYAVDPDELFDFALEEKNYNIIPPNIKYWIDFAGGYSDSMSVKGIMFDTNDESCEKYMFENNVVAAWGRAKRYVNSFKKDDIVFFYKKGYGVIAAGKILTDEPREIDNGLEHCVDIMIAPRKGKTNKWISITPKEIKLMVEKNFWFATTRKVPFLSEQECRLLINALKDR